MTADPMEAYFEAGEARANSLGNRGPLRFDERGQLDPSILEAYRRTGFYVFEGVVDDDELAELHADFANLLDRTPASEGDATDRKGRPLTLRPEGTAGIVRAYLEDRKGRAVHAEAMAMQWRTAAPAFDHLVPVQVTRALCREWSAWFDVAETPAEDGEGEA